MQHSMHRILQSNVGLQNLAADPSTSRRWTCHKQTGAMAWLTLCIFLKHRSLVPNASNAVAGCRNKHKRHTRRSAAQTDTETETDMQIEGALSTANCQENACIVALWPATSKLDMPDSAH